MVDHFASARFHFVRHVQSRFQQLHSSITVLYERRTGFHLKTPRSTQTHTMAIEAEDSRAFVLAALKGKGKGKKRSTDAPSTSALKKTPNKLTAKKRQIAAKKAKSTPVVAEEPQADVEVKRLRQDALQWKLLSAQPEDFGDDFAEDIDVASDSEKRQGKVSRKAKSDPMANLFDNEGGMMMLEEVEDVDVIWEEDGKGGKKAILVVSDRLAAVDALLISVLYRKPGLNPQRRRPVNQLLQRRRKQGLRRAPQKPKRQRTRSERGQRLSPRTPLKRRKRWSPSRRP